MTTLLLLLLLSASVAFSVLEEKVFLASGGRVRGNVHLNTFLYLDSGDHFRSVSLWTELQLN